VFTDLLEYSRGHPGYSLDSWWSERRCARAIGAFVRPDGYGLWTTPNRQTRFYLEYDRGTETLDRVAAKLEDYAALAAAQGPTVVLMHLPGPRREAALRRIIQAHPLAKDTATSCAGLHPAGCSWLPARSSGRVHLQEIAISEP
jgi:hypothetical protein